jgi:hypothetical protein
MKNLLLLLRKSCSWLTPAAAQAKAKAKVGNNLGQLAFKGLVKRAYFCLFGYVSLRFLFLTFALDCSCFCEREKANAKVNKNKN